MPTDLPTLKADLDLAADDTRDDAVLQTQLDAALEFARHVRGDLNWDLDPGSELPEPSATHELGVIRLAGRWYTRRRSPDALIAMGEMGSTRVPSFDADIERLLGIGRYRGPVFA